MAFCLIFKSFKLIPFMFFSLDFMDHLPHGSIYAVHLHPISNHATCVTWVHVVGDFFHTACLSQAVIRHPTPGDSKNVKFRLSRNSMKFDVVARFREMIPTVKSIWSSEI